MIASTLRLTTRAILLVATGFILLTAIWAAPSASAGTTSAKTGQGIMANLTGDGVYAVQDYQILLLNLNDPTITDKNGVTLPASAYFTNAWDGNAPSFSCSGLLGCGGSNQPPAPAAPAADPTKVTVQCVLQSCTFLKGGTLQSTTYTLSKTISGLNGRGNWTFTYTYNVTPDPQYDVDSSTDGVQVNPFTAYYVWKEKALNDGLADLTFTAQIAGESVVVSSKFPCTSGAPGTANCGKFSYTLLESDGTNRIQNLALTITDNNNNNAVVGTANPGSTVNYPVDFNFSANAGLNGNTQYLRSGDARTILNTDVFAGNDNGGADGSALALGTTDPETFSLPAGDYTVTLTGTVKGIDTVAAQTFTVTEVVHVLGACLGGGVNQ